MQGNSETTDLAGRSATAVKNAFDVYINEFKEITRRAKSRFEGQDWRGMQEDALERLELYPNVIRVIVADIQNILGSELRNKALWEEKKNRYSRLIAGIDSFELAETFFNSVTRRIFTTVGVDPSIEFVDSDFEASLHLSDNSLYRTYLPKRSTKNLILEVLEDYPFQVGYRQPGKDASLVSEAMDEYISSTYPDYKIERLEILEPVFYRGKSAYLIGRIFVGPYLSPIVLPLHNSAEGINVDTVLLSQDETSIVFSFAHSYFHVQATKPNQLIAFLKSVMPLKRLAELYISIGFNKHGKTELYRDLLSHLARSEDRFEIARGEKGMVMLVFTLPSYDLVFKVIRDKFSQPKMTTRQEVLDRYQLVFKHDRAGRLVDAQAFEHLTFEKKRFSEELLEEMLETASNSITIDGEYVAIKHLYTERRLTPLNLYLKEVNLPEAREVALDYGNAIKDLAATNIFPGDILLKNFGVTRHGRVVFYDYDELCLLTACKFRVFPAARSFSDDFEAEPWFYVGKNDIFPEEFRTFLGLQGEMRDDFIQAHSDLFGVEFWRQMQDRHRKGEVVEIFPYKQGKRFQNQDLRLFPGRGRATSAANRR